MDSSELKNEAALNPSVPTGVNFERVVGNNQAGNGSDEVGIL
jgi:hypothetical protein